MFKKDENNIKTGENPRYFPKQNMKTHMNCKVGKK